MKLRESGMPEEAFWETLFDVPLILDRLGIDGGLKNVVENPRLGGQTKLLEPASVVLDLPPWHDGLRLKRRT